MKRPALCLLIVAIASAQSTAAPVLRTVFFAPPTGVVLTGETRALVLGAPEMLATALSSIQPYTRVDSPDLARSVVSVQVVDGGQGHLSVTIALHDTDGGSDQANADFASAAIDISAFTQLLDGAARRFAPRLGPVPPQVDILKVTKEQELIFAAQQTDYLDTLDTRWSFSLLSSGLLRLLDSTGVTPGGASFSALSVFPLVLEADWFFGRNFGALASFYFNDSNAFDFGHHSRYLATGIFLFPGIGIVYRTLGVISAEYAITLSAGWIHLTADAGDVKDENQLVALPQGSSTWSALSPRIRIAPSLIWNVSPAIGLKATIGFDFIFPGTFPWYTDSPLADFQFLGLGFAWRM